MIAEVIYSHPLPVGAIVACTFGMLIGLGLIIGTTVLVKQNKIKTLQIVLFYVLGIAIISGSLVSLLNSLN